MNTTCNTHDKEVSLITQLLECNVGHCIEFFGILKIYELEDESFAVVFQGKEEEWEEIFTDAKEAAQFFVTQRETHQLGFDFERVE